MNSGAVSQPRIFTLKFAQTTINHAEGNAADRQSKLNMVDLAGSERVKQSGARASGYGRQINKSLSTLGQCINRLSDAAVAGSGGADAIAVSAGAIHANKAG